MLKKKEKEIINILKKGGVGVMPTDTLYGLVGRADSSQAQKRIYKIKNRNPKKKLIVLISSLKDLEKFGIKRTYITKNIEILRKNWPGRTSIIVKNTAFRLPAKKSLIEILKKTGPLVAPSANPEGLSPARSILEAKKYFGDKADFYLAGGTLKGKPSRLLRLLKNGKVEVLRD